MQKSVLEEGKVSTCNTSKVFMKSNPNVRKHY